MYGQDIYVKFEGYHWNSTQNILLVHWKIQFVFTVELRLEISNAFLDAPQALISIGTAIEV